MLTIQKKTATNPMVFFGHLHLPGVAPPGYDPSRGTVSFLPRNDPLAPRGTRRIRIKSVVVPPAPSRPDAQWLNPLPLDMEVPCFLLRGLY
jgi:hypothetical protein